MYTFLLCYFYLSCIKINKNVKTKNQIKHNPCKKKKKLNLGLCLTRSNIFALSKAKVTLIVMLPVASDLLLAEKKQCLGTTTIYNAMAKHLSNVLLLGQIKPNKTHKNTKSVKSVVRGVQNNAECNECYRAKAEIENDREFVKGCRQRG